MKLHFIHRWKTIDDNEHTKYKECSKCFKRTYSKKAGGDQPLDWDWLNGKTLFLKRLSSLYQYKLMLKIKLENWQNKNFISVIE